MESSVTVYIICIFLKTDCDFVDCTKRGISTNSYSHNSQTERDRGLVSSLSVGKKGRGISEIIKYKGFN